MQRLNRDGKFSSEVEINDTILNFERFGQSWRNFTLIIATKKISGHGIFSKRDFTKEEKML